LFSDVSGLRVCNHSAEDSHRYGFGTAWHTGDMQKKGVSLMNKRREMVLFAGFVTLLLVLGGLSQVYAQAKTVTVKGEVIDTYCYSLMGAKGESHRQCVIDCFKAGIPAGLLENGTNKVFVLLPNKDKTSLPQSAILEKMGRQASITGKVYTVGGSNFLTVESVK
jgi:hypothetical protein